MNSQSPNRSRKILFHHIPKTGGTSLIEHAYDKFPSMVCNARYDPELTDDLIDDDQLIFFHGHYSHATVRRFRIRHPDAFIFTFLRHPFARVLSQYHNWIDRERVERELSQIKIVQGENPDLTRLQERFESLIFDMSLDEFLNSDDDDITHVVANLQAQYMTEYGEPTYHRYQRSIPNAMMYYDFIGLQEFYGPCLRIIEAKCGLPLESLGGDRRSNTSDAAKLAGTYEIDATQVQIIERRNAYDLSLFYTVFAELYRNYGASLPPLNADIEGLTGIRIV